MSYLKKIDNIKITKHQTLSLQLHPKIIIVSARCVKFDSH